MKHNYKNLKIWKLGIEIVDNVYDLIDELPSNERFNLVSQSIRSACSIPANIAEGSAKSSDKDFKRFLEISLGSSYELETHLLICQRRKYGVSSKLSRILDQIDEEQKMLIGLIKNLSSKVRSNNSNIKNRQN